MRITKCHKCGLPDPKAKPIEATFCMDSDRGSNAIGGVATAPSGEIVAYALEDNGRRVLPDLKNAQLVGWYANGFRLRGYCEETLRGSFHSFYCEWFVFFTPEQTPKTQPAPSTQELFKKP